jgi:hypothetical protein
MTPRVLHFRSDLHSHLARITAGGSEADGLPLDEAALDLQLVVAWSQPACPLQEHLHRRMTHLVLREDQRGQSRAQERSDLSIIKADHRHVVRDAATCLFERVVAAHRHEIVGAEDRIGRLGEREEGARALIARYRLPVAGPDQGGVEGQVVAG